MFNKKITPFACLVITLIAVIITAVGVSTYKTVTSKALLDEYRASNSVYYDYAGLIDAVGEDSDNYEKLAQILSMVEEYYVRDYDNDALWENIYRSLVLSIGDTYGGYLTVEEYNELVDTSDGDFVGIGVHAVYDSDTNGIYIFGVMPDSPAEQGGLRNGDIIVAAEGIEASAENYYDMLDTIRGVEGTEVEVTVLRDGEKIDFTLVRAAVASENVLYEKLDNGIAYVRILSFADENVSEEFATKIALAQSEGCEKFIFDVRNNSGGYLDEICDVLDLLLPEGPIINIVYADEQTSTLTSDANCIEGEMVVICNDATASAAELFTAALRDYELADIVGKTTYGKGTMQTTRLLADGSAFKLSTAYYNPPSNVSYDGVGIVPDHDVDLDEKWADRFFKMPREEDAQFLYALSLLGSTN